MERISIFDMLKIGVGPSSSHTMGPWRAAQRFLAALEDEGELVRIARISVDLFGSLAKTGKGHATDLAVQLGLSGEDPVSIDVARIPEVIGRIAATETLWLDGRRAIPFRPAHDIHFRADQQLAFHPNALRFRASLPMARREKRPITRSVADSSSKRENRCRIVRPKSRIPSSPPRICSPTATSSNVPSPKSSSATSSSGGQRPKSAKASPRSGKSCSTVSTQAVIGTGNSREVCM